MRSDTGKMIPLDDLVTVEQTANPQVISHYNLFRSAEINGSAAPGRSSGDAIADMEALAQKVLPNGMTFEWSGLSLEELESGGKALNSVRLGTCRRVPDTRSPIRKFCAALHRAARRARRASRRHRFAGVARIAE